MNIKQPVKNGLDITTYKWVRNATPEEIRTEVDDLRDMREVNGIPQGDVAKILEVHQPQVSALETGTGVASVKFTSRYIFVMRKMLNLSNINK